MTGDIEFSRHRVASLEPLLGEPAHVQPRFTHERDLELLLEVLLLLGYLLQGILHQVRPGVSSFC